jgi:purine-binding chemotaxis protein CheW
MENAKAGQYLTFNLNEELYGVPIEAIREINRVGEITPVPRTPSYIKGVMNLRGRIVPVVNLRTKFSLPEQAFTRDTCIVVIESDFNQIGMIVDAVKEVIDLKTSDIEPPPQLGQATKDRFITGLGKVENRVVILVDIVSALSYEDHQELKELSERQAA